MGCEWSLFRGTGGAAALSGGLGRQRQDSMRKDGQTAQSCKFRRLYSASLVRRALILHIMYLYGVDRDASEANLPRAISVSAVQTLKLAEKGDSGAFSRIPGAFGMSNRQKERAASVGLPGRVRFPLACQVRSRGTPPGAEQIRRRSPAPSWCGAVARRQVRSRSTPPGADSGRAADRRGAQVRSHGVVGAPVGCGAEVGRHPEREAVDLTETYDYLRI